MTKKQENSRHGILAAFIRQHPSLPPSEVVKLGKSKSIALTSDYVVRIRHRDQKKTGGKTSNRRFYAHSGGTSDSKLAKKREKARYGSASSLIRQHPATSPAELVRMGKEKGLDFDKHYVTNIRSTDRVKGRAGGEKRGLSLSEFVLLRLTWKVESIVSQALSCGYPNVTASYVKLIRKRQTEREPITPAPEPESEETAKPSTATSFLEGVKLALKEDEWARQTKEQAVRRFQKALAEIGLIEGLRILKEAEQSNV